MARPSNPLLNNHVPHLHVELVLQALLLLQFLLFLAHNLFGCGHLAATSTLLSGLLFGLRTSFLFVVSGLVVAVENQVWSLTQFYSVGFSQSRIGVNKCVLYKRTIKVCVSCP